MHICLNELRDRTSRDGEVRPLNPAHNYSVFKNSTSESGAR